MVRNISMYNSSEGARIKVWPDSFSEKSANLKGGGGTGSVRNVTYDGMWLDNVDYGITITQCYGQDDEEECFKHPVKLSITAHLQHGIYADWAKTGTLEYLRHILQEHSWLDESCICSSSRTSGLLESRYLLKYSSGEHRY